MTGAGSRGADPPLLEVLRLQRDSCAQAGSGLYATLLEATAHDVEVGGICATLLADHASDALARAVPLRFLGGLHRIVLDGRAPGLGAFYPSVQGQAGGDPVPAFLTAVHDHADELRQRLHEGVQTNEVGRAASLAVGFHEAHRRSGLPLRILEVGASAGLLLRWNRYSYRQRGRPWGDTASAVVFDEAWSPEVPDFSDTLTVVSRRGCDIHPVDVGTDDGAQRLRSFLWPDQLERRARLDAAIAEARRDPVTVDRADAGDWVTAQLAAPVTGVATVVYHSIVVQYLPRGSADALRGAVARAGQQATPDAPVFWLRMEPAGDVAEVRLTSWPGGDDRRLAVTGYHGPPVVGTSEADPAA